MGVLNTTPRTWGTEIVTPAMLNAEVRDALTALQSAGTSYTPTLTNITLGNGSLSFVYHQMGKWVLAVSGIFVAGSTTTYAAGNLGFSLPVAPHSRYTSNAGIPVGSSITKIGSSQGGTAFITSTGILNFLVDNLASANTVTNLIPSTWNTTSTLAFTVGPYEAA